MKRIAVLPILAVMVAMALVVGGGRASGAEDPVIYDSTVKPLPGNLPSVGAEAYAFNEFGDEVVFAGTARNLTSVIVTLSSWGCQTGHWYSLDCTTAPGARFSMPITLNVYQPATNTQGTPVAGALIITKTQTFSVPYRPSADNAHCTLADMGKWYSATDHKCYNGLATNIVFNFGSGEVALPDKVVYGIVYNTTHYGPHPYGETASCFSSLSNPNNCPYDSLNIALAPKVNVGSKPFTNTVFQNSSIPTEYCDNGLAGISTFRLDSPSNACWFDTTTLQSYIPAVQFNATNGEHEGHEGDHGHGDDHGDHGKGFGGKDDHHDSSHVSPD